MVLYLLDTSTITLLQRRNTRVVANVKAQPAGTIGIPTVSVDEVAGGYIAALRRAKTNAREAFIAARFAEAIELLGRFPIVPTTEPALDRSDGLLKLKLNVGGRDLKIAAVALELAATVVTNNARDFARVPNLSWVDWSV